MHNIDRTSRRQYYKSMKTLVSTQTMESIDSKAQEEYAVSGLILMEQAGIKGWQAFLNSRQTCSPALGQVVFVVGGGNNGGDALVMAREAYFSGLKNFSILLFGSNISYACSIQRAIAEKYGFRMYEAVNLEGALSEVTMRLLSEADLIVDGIAGTGLRGVLRGAVAEVVKLINTQKKRGVQIFSIDIPSGCGDSLPVGAMRVLADTTVTMGLTKAAAYHPLCRAGWGNISCVNPSFPPQLLQESVPVATLSTAKELKLTSLGEDTYKNKRGHLALFAGSLAYTGAARLAARGAFHSRCGLVTLCCDQEVAAIAATETASIIIRPIEKNMVISASKLGEKYQAIAAGPGWGEGHEDQLIELMNSQLPTVLDADAIATFANVVVDHRVQGTAHGPLILTPHPGELHRMLETLHMPLLAQEIGPLGTPESFVEALKHISETLECVLVYKSHVIWIADGRTIGKPPIVVDGMNNAMGVAGSGDVLTGIIGALLAQGYDALEAAHTGVLIHQAAGLAAREENGWFDSEILVGQVGVVCRHAEMGTA